MSGIFGLIYKNKEDKGLVYKMSVPYGNGLPIDCFFVKSAAFGARRELLDTERRDAYGFSDGRNFHAIISGEISNRSELINAEKGILAKENGDAEILAYLFKRYSTECIKKINGQFCAAVWDEKEEKLYLMLDRVGGIKSLFYTLTDEGFAFGSTIHSILSIPWVKREIETNSFINLFTSGYILPPKSLVKNINKLRPGEVITYKDSRIHSQIIDRICFNSNEKKENGVDELYNRVYTAIKSLSCEEDIAFLLSGGIDSSSIVAIASKELNKRIRTFCASFPGSDLDESYYAKKVAKAYACENEFIDLSGDNFLDDLPHIVWNLDEPFLDFSAIPTYYLFKNIREKTSVVISGDGPDHLFGRYYPLAAKRYLANKIGFLRPFLKKIPVAFLNKVARVANCKLPQSYNEIFTIPTWGIDNADTIKDLFSPEITENSIDDHYFSEVFVGRENSFEEIFDAISYVDFYIDGSFGVFTKVGKMAAANDLFVREPYLDREVSDFIAGLPLRHKIRGNWMDILLSRAMPKYLLKYELAPKILPPEIINKKKGGFTPPLKRWLREKICDNTIEKVFCNTLLGGSYFNKSYLQRIFVEHSNGAKDWSTLIFMLLSFDLWVRMIIERNFETFPNWRLSEVYK